MKSRSIKLQRSFRENGDRNIHVRRKAANRIGRTAGNDCSQGTSSGICQDPHSEGKRPLGVKQMKCECSFRHNHETDCGPSLRYAVQLCVIPDVSEKPVRRGSSTYATSDPRISNCSRKNVFSMPYLFWVTRRRNIVAIIRRFGIFFIPSLGYFLIKPEDGFEMISRKAVSLLQYYAACFKQ